MNKQDSLTDLTIFMISYISSLKIIDVVVSETKSEGQWPDGINPNALSAWQNTVTRFLTILSYPQYLGYLGLENGKTQ